MSIVVEHDKRKHEILDKALDVFLEEGYSGASYQKIADRCGIARTILYTYFKNKREIFRFTIKQVTESLERSFQPVLENSSLGIAEKIERIGVAVIEKCVEERRLFSIILDYLLEQQREKGKTEDLIRRRVIRLRMLVSRLLMDGIKAGEIRDVDVKGVTESFYSLIEGAIVKLVIMDAKDVSDTTNAMRTLASLLKT
jgi:AcrR family transcriptional regulator